MTLWEVDIYPAPGERDLIGGALSIQSADMGLGQLAVSAARGFLIEGSLDQAQVDRLSKELLADLAVETPLVGQAGDAALSSHPAGITIDSQLTQLVYVLPKPGVTDPVAESTLRAIADFGFDAKSVVTLRKYWLPQLEPARLELLCKKLLANESIERVIVGPLEIETILFGKSTPFKLVHAPIRELSDEQLVKLSKENTLSLTLVEMQTIQQHFRDLGREPTDAELESVAQTWSEHCSHKTLAGMVRYRDENGERVFKSMLKETIFAATQQLRKTWGESDWCVSVFRDNAGIVTFSDDHHVAFKVETHNRPSAIEPYGGANTGVGGVIRDTLGTGLGAKPLCNTDVFCFADPSTPVEELPPGVLHPRRIMRGVVAGVRDYGNRMGIPTVNGALYFDRRYVGNPLVFCGNVGLVPKDKAFKETQPGDLIVAMGGRTGRDGIHGATFSSVELTSQSEKVSGGAVQIGNAITEKMVLDVLLRARDEELFTAVTDCGAGGFSSAVGEMGADIGAEVWLDRCPLKYDGLTYTEVWISEAQERMVLSVPEDKWPQLEALCKSENVEATAIGRFTPTGRLKLKYGEHEVADISMEFLHEGRPKVERLATYQPAAVEPVSLPAIDHNQAITALLGELNIASKEWVIRQYDHEVQAGSVVKPLTGAHNDGPSDAAVIRPVLSLRKGLVIANGMNPKLGEYDTYDMAAASIDEAVRNCVAVGADPSKIAILDNFCWGYTDRPETLGSLTRAAIACQEVALALGTPFISGKDSLNNEYSYFDSEGKRVTISIPPTLLISAMAQVDDVAKCVTMDLKEPGNLLYQVGLTKAELAGSHLELATDTKIGGHWPKLDLTIAGKIYASVYAAIQKGYVRACHDISEGGLAVAVAEMAFAGDCGAHVRLADVPLEDSLTDPALRIASALYSESCSRFVLEVPADKQAAVEELLQAVPFAQIGRVMPLRRVSFAAPGGALAIDHDLATLKRAWQEPLAW